MPLIKAQSATPQPGGRLVPARAAADLAAGLDERVPVRVPRRAPHWARWFIAADAALLAAAVSGVLGAYEPAAIMVVGALTLWALVFAIRHYRPSLTWPWWAMSSRARRVPGRRRRPPRASTPWAT